jgi:hypothetical protein
LCTGLEEKWDITAINYFARGPPLAAVEWVTLPYRIRGGTAFRPPPDGLPRLQSVLYLYSRMQFSRHLSEKEIKLNLRGELY